MYPAIDFVRVEVREGVSMVKVGYATLIRSLFMGVGRRGVVSYLSIFKRMLACEGSI